MCRWSRVWSVTLLLTCSWFYCTFSTSGKQLDFVIRPVPVVAPLGSNATFHCSITNALILEWTINDQNVDPEVDYEVLRDRMIVVVGPTNDSNGTSSSLVVAATIGNNQIMVTCIGFVEQFGPETVESEAVSLTVYGRPEPPQNISAEPLAPLRLNITWLPPYSLPEVQVTYKVIVTDESTSERYESGSISENFYVFERSHFSCDNYTISVLAVNDAGASDTTQVEHVPLPTVPVISVADVSHTVQLHSGNASVEFSVTPAQSCSAYPVRYYSLTLNVSTGTDENITVEETSGSPILTATSLMENANYIYWVQAHNEIGSVMYDSGVLYTTDVQDPQLLSAAGKVIRVQCQYAVGSEAQGCFVTVSYPNGTLYMVANSTQGEAEIELSTPLPAHCYDVYVYDWEMDGTMGELAIPVNTAVWNDSCSTVTPPPTLETAGVEGDEFPTLLVAVSAAVGSVLLSLSLVIIFIVALKLRNGKARARTHDKPSLSFIDGVCHQTNGKYHSNGCQSSRPDSRTTEDTLLSTNPVTYDLIQNHPLRERSSSSPCQATYSSLSRQTFQSSLSSHPDVSLTPPPLQGEAEGNTEYAQLNQLPIYQVLECSTPPQAQHPDQPPPPDRPPEYQEIGDFPPAIKSLAIKATNPVILVQRNEYSEIPSAGTSV